MALSPQLLQFKSSGVYRLEFDKSITSDLNVDTLRLIVGHSKKGPYNTPVLINSTEDFINVFGTIDRSLEKKGMFFHRSALEALSRGPILALNLTKFNESDKASYVAPITNGTVDSISSEPAQEVYADFFNVDKFMTPSDASVLETVDSGADRLINFVNIKQSGITVIVRQAQDVKAFELTAREWYGEGSVPAHLNEFDYMSDFMVDVFVFRGEFEAAKMANDPIYGEFFTADGLDKTKLDQFANLRQVTLEAKYTGSLLPGFKDLEGRNLYIESIVNQESRRTGLFCAINEDEVLNGGLDLVGHTYDADQDYELLSHIVKQSVTTTTVTFPEIGIDTDLDPLTNEYVTATVVDDTWTIANYDATSLFVAGDFLAAASAGEYVEILSVSYDAATFETTIVAEGNIAASYAFAHVAGEDTDKDKYAVSQGRVIAEAFAGATYAAAGSLFSLTYATAPTSIALSVGDYVQAEEAGRLAKVKRVAKSGNVYTVYCDVNVPATWGGEYVKSFENASTVYKTFVLSGAQIADKLISEILNVLSGSGLYNALIDKDMIDFRYVVDTFTSYDATGILNKRQLSQLAMDRQNASAILNAPTVADFRASTDPSFLDDDKAFRVEYIAEGGNLSKNPTKLYALPSINEGANYAFYYGPGLIVSDNGKDIIVPPAAYVSNNFIDKYTNALPWSIVAGPRRGVVSGTNVKGAEYAFDKSDRDVLEPFGINPIVFQRGVGLTILGNKTAQQSVKSALSSAHVREVLIYIQEGIANILKDYVFEFNNTQTRLEIKTLADAFLESVKQDGGVYDFKNIMDQTNNTDDVIDNNYGIIDTYVEPVKGLEIVVHRTTVLNTGEIQTGNFN
jgi:hypothetical protein